MPRKQKQLTQNLAAARRNLDEKLKELSDAQQRLKELASERENLSVRYDALDRSDRSDVSALKQIRVLRDGLERCENLISNLETGILPKLESDLQAMVDIGRELYGEGLQPRIAKLEGEITDFLRPYYDGAKLAQVLSMSNCLSYLEAHKRLQFPPGTDPCCLALWLIRRLDFLLKNEDAIPWGKHRPEPIGARATPQPSPADPYEAEERECAA